MHLEHLMHYMILKIYGREKTKPQKLQKTFY